jgi:hypothetical protein
MIAKNIAGYQDWMTLCFFMVPIVKEGIKSI